MSFDQIAETQAGMLGFAVSPDGDRIAFGGPFDGLFEAPSDASAPPSKVSDLQVSCLRWQSSGVYACANETTATYSLGYATDPTQEFTPLWHRADTCRESCAPPSRLEMLCRKPWEMIAPMIGAADGGLCEASSPIPDGGVDGARAGDAGTEQDGGSMAVDASRTKPESRTPARAREARGCSVTSPAGVGVSFWLAVAGSGHPSPSQSMHDCCKSKARHPTTGTIR
jgi:hypothetical protein